MCRCTEFACFSQNPVAWDANVERTGLMYLGPQQRGPTRNQICIGCERWTTEMRFPSVDVLAGVFPCTCAGIYQVLMTSLGVLNGSHWHVRKVGVKKGVSVAVGWWFIPGAWDSLLSVCLTRAYTCLGQNGWQKWQLKDSVKTDCW